MQRRSVLEGNMQHRSVLEDTIACSEESQATDHDASSLRNPHGHAEARLEEDRLEDHDEGSAPSTAGFMPSSTDNQSSRDEVREIEAMIRQETKTVRLWRWVVLIAMLFVAGGVTTATYFFLVKEETSSFEDSFNQYAKNVLSASRLSAKTIRSTCSDLSDTITAGALREHAQWPFYTVPSWSVIAGNLLRQTESFGTWISVNVNAEQQANWTDYVLANANEWYGNTSFPPYIWSLSTELEPSFELGHPGPYRPVWQIYPMPMNPMTNYDLTNHSVAGPTLQKTIALQEGLVGIVNKSSLAAIFSSLTNSSFHRDEPYSSYTDLVYDNFNKTSRTWVATIQVFIRWGLIFSGKLPKGVQGIHLVLENTCNETLTWEIVGGEAIFLNATDLHDRAFDRYKLSSEFNTYENVELAKKLGVCFYTLSVYPSSTFEDYYRSSTPIIGTCLVGAVVLSMVASFLAYDNFQRKRTTKVVANAAKSNALVTSLFPSNVRDRLLPVDDGQSNGNTNTTNSTAMLKHTTANNTPIADLFLETTILFADITGFTAWSSVREPTQVFILLETVFSALDRIAQKRRVFKVETVGDCYVAASGLPEPRVDHAVTMARFANDAIPTIHEVVKRLEVSLGPDTGDLGVRIGLHSGVVTAGVLRGERARFQLFGDTVNTTARIESTGARNKIHASKQTADLLIAAGKGHWVRPRKDLVSAKGKGTMQTYWIDLCQENSTVTQPLDATEREVKHNEASPADLTLWADAEVADSKMERLIDWQVDVFSRLLKQVIARRNVGQKPSKTNDPGNFHMLFDDETRIKNLNSGSCLDEVKEIICLPDFEDQAEFIIQANPNMIALDQAVVEQLRKYISAVANMYRSNAFHNFEHACHVTMSVTKLLSRIVKPSDLPCLDVTQNVCADNEYSIKVPPKTITITVEDVQKQTIAYALHERTYGITADPLTQFSVVFSALIHDVDHAGVPNTTLIKENAQLASTYHNKSVAEQNSINLAWDLLQDTQFRDLRSCIFTSPSEYDRFRQLVVQTVLATDIVDQELKVLRNARWDRAFEENGREESPRDSRNRKATIVIEHLIQASDVAHTMQHWHVYRKWNENFFRECYQAYRDGRAENDPSLGWYEGELGFFDFYIIPLARKLKACGVFGVSSDEYLNYAMANRQEWEDRGQEVVEQMVQAIHEQQTRSISSSVVQVVPVGKKEVQNERPSCREFTSL